LWGIRQLVWRQQHVGMLSRASQKLASRLSSAWPVCAAQCTSACFHTSNVVNAEGQGRWRQWLWRLCVHLHIYLSAVEGFFRKFCILVSCGSCEKCDFVLSSSRENGELEPTGTSKGLGRR
jgi:hypothetical protein